ncbi:uncharacterized protein LOC129809683 [Phlebotomus papatasi]|uniref:uncharacterized protein LOC129809683 n=1 Tax=Phlebotomus papatasi TaxID=29031 RepID=UPI002483476A|nr:uncharacterized protein LOC129809683 [Phlebotomus papatasi]
MSQSSKQDLPDTSSDSDSLESFCKKVLKSRIFLGEFKEKRLVSPLESYRDVIVVDVHSESAIANDLDIVCCKLLSVHGQKGDNHWIGVTKSHNRESVLIWTELESFYTFGRYWFQIKTVRFRNNEILLKLKVLRSVDDPPPRTAEQELNFKWEDFDWPLIQRMGKDFGIWIQQQLRNFLIFLLSLRINPSQIIPFIKMTILVIISAVVSSIHVVQALGDFSLRLIAEIRKCVHVLTPLFLGTLDVFSKIVGGFYMLIAMIWRDSINLGMPRNQFQPLPPPRRWAPRKAIRN